MKGMDISKFEGLIKDFLISLKNRNNENKDLINRNNLIRKRYKHHIENTEEIKHEDVIKKLIQSEDFKAALISSTDSQGRTIYDLSYAREHRKFVDCSKYLLSVEDVYNKYSEIYIENVLGRLCRELLSGRDGIECNIKDKVNNLIKELKKEPKAYRIFSEIENITIADNEEYRLIDATIKIFSLEDMDSIPKEIQGEPKVSELLNKPCIYSDIKAGDRYKAKELASHNFRVSFSFLNLYNPFFKPFLKGQLLPEIQSVATTNETEEPLSNTFSKHNKLLRPVLAQHYYNTCLKPEIKKLENEMPEKINERIIDVVKECLYWFGLGLDEKHPSAKLLNFVTVLDASLKKKGETTDAVRNFYERGALILSDTYKERCKTREKLKEIYNLRSKAVHKAVLIDEKIDKKEFDKEGNYPDSLISPVSLAESYSREILKKLIGMSKDFDGDLKKFVNHIDNMKMLGKFNDDQMYEENNKRRSN